MEWLMDNNGRLAGDGPRVRVEYTQSGADWATEIGSTLASQETHIKPPPRCRSPFL